MKIEVIVRIGHYDMVTCSDPTVCTRIYAELTAFEEARNPEQKVADLRNEMADIQKALDKKNVEWASAYTEKEDLKKKLKELGHGS